MPRQWQRARDGAATHPLPGLENMEMPPSLPKSQAFTAPQFTQALRTRDDNSSPSSHHEGLSTEAGIGVGVGIAFVLVLLIGSGCFAWRFRRSRRRQRVTKENQGHEPDNNTTPELDSQTRTELSSLANTPEMSSGSPATIAELTGQGLTAELDHDEKGMAARVGAVHLAQSRGGLDDKHPRTYEIAPPFTPPDGPQELAAYPFQRDEEAAYGQEPNLVSPQSPLPRYQSVRSYEKRQSSILPPSPESVTQQQLQYYVGGRRNDATRNQPQQRGHVPGSEEEMEVTLSPTLESMGASTLVCSAESRPA